MTRSRLVWQEIPLEGITCETKQIFVSTGEMRYELEGAVMKSEKPGEFTITVYLKEVGA